MNPTEEIKERLDVVEVISGYLKVQKAGRNFSALCPFHNEKTPSFMISPERQMWHCFGCGEGGDIFDFVMKMEGLEFVDALRILAQRAGVVLKKQDPKIHSERSRLYEICELSAKFFSKQLQASKAGKEAKKYLKKRGLTESTIASWRLGFAPDGWENLSAFLRQKGYSEKGLVAAGLCLPGQRRGGIYDRFRSRIMFPLFDGHGQVIGFAGRVFGQEDDKQGKYINTPQTLIYDKSRVLYGLHTGKIAIRKNDRCVLVEGNLDVILSQQAGLTETLAASGTALTQKQLVIIKRYTGNLLLAFDADEAGLVATKKAVSLALEEGFLVKVIALKNSQDPADIVLLGKEKWRKRVRGAEPFLDFLLNKLFEKNDVRTSEGKRKIAQEALLFIKKISNSVERAHWLSVLAGKLQINERYLYEALNKVTQDKKDSSSTPKALESLPKKDISRQQKLQEFAVAFLLTSKKARDLKEEIYAQVEDDLKKITKIFLDQRGNQKKTTEKAKDQKLISRTQQLLFLGEQMQATKEELITCLNELKKINLKKQISRIGEKLKESETKKQGQQRKKHLAKLQKLLEELNSLDSNAQN